MKAQEFLKQSHSTDVFKEAKACKNAEELLKFASDHDVEMTSEEANNFLAGKTELSNEELDNITGGRDYYNHDSNKICPKCGGELVCLDASGTWHHGCDGQAYNLYQCKACGKKFDWFWEDAGWADD